MAAELSRELSDLHLCVEEGGQTAAVRANDTVGNIARICLVDLSEKYVDFCCAQLFSKETGVVAFLNKVIQEDAYQGSKVESLDMLLAYLRKYEGKLLPYLTDMKHVCMSLFLRDRFAKVKNAALPLLIEVIQQSTGSNLGEELKIRKMVEKMFLELVSASKHSATVKQNIYHLLGVVTESYPELVMEYSTRLVDIYVQTLKSQMTSKTKKPELTLIAGSLQGLTHLLVHFTQSADEGAKHAYDIYKYARLAIAKDLKLARFDMPKSGLQLLTKHAAQFNEYILDDHKDMYDRLLFWSNHHNRDLQHLGISALEAFYKQISEMLVSHAKEGRKEAAVFKFFIQELKKVMDNPNSTSKEISLAIRGYGFFAMPCRIFLSTEDVKFMFNEMIQRSEQVYFGQTEGIEDKVIGLPNFLEALASIVLEMDEISDTFLMALEKLVVLLMETFPKLPQKLHYVCFLSILKICFSLAPRGAVFKGFLSRIVYQGLLRTCSHPVVMETDNSAMDVNEEITMETRQQTITYKDYLEMWDTLLNCSQLKALTSLNLSLEERQSFTECVYDELLSSVLLVTERLDLQSNKQTDEPSEESAGTSNEENNSAAVSSDPIHGLHAAKPKDFIIFINMVDFCGDLLPKVQVQLFQKWVFTFGHQLILYSTKLPLVSGFYKLLSVCMKMAGTINYFKSLGDPSLTSVTQQGQPEVKPEVKQELSMEIDSESNTDGDQQLSQKEACFLLFVKFTKEVLIRLKQYKDDLLCSCLYFVLALPREIVVSELPSIVPAVQTTFQLGRSYLPLANAGLDALELWSRILPPGVFRPHYKEVLRYLDPYLKSSTDSGKGASDPTVALTSLKPSSRNGRKKIPVKLLQSAKKSKHKTSKVNYESQLDEVRQRCVVLLGSLGGSVNNVLVSGSAEDLGRSAVAWDSIKHLKFEMPFVDIKPTIYFDSFLPRVVELATTSSERQTKVAACELLHSLVLYTLGRSTQQPGAQRPTAPGAEDMKELYKRLLPVVMQLACDVEQVTRQLFEPLVFQLIHWFTSSKMFGRDETQVLLQTIMDGLVSPTDTALRDFSATSLKEYLKWAIKQTSKKQMEESPRNVKMLMKSLFGLAKHPSAFKRLGAALGFNNIYTIFREEDSLVDMFIFEILVVFIESLAIAHQDDKSLGTQEQTKMVLDHIEKIIKKKSEQLSAKSKRRKKPKEWADASIQTCLRWLVRQCGRPQTECRHACMKLVSNLAPCIPVVKKPQDFFQALLRTNADYFVQRFELGMFKASLGNQGIAIFQSMSHLDSTFKLHNALSWFDLLLAALDCYTWVYSSDLLNPATSLTVTGKGKTVLFDVLAQFFDSLARGSIEEAAKLFASYQQRDIFTPRERDEYDRAKCTVIVRVMDFIVVLLRNFTKECLQIIPVSFWSTSLWETFVCCVLEPSSLGFNMGNIEILTQLPQQTNQLLVIITRYLPESLLKGFRAQLDKFVNHKGSTALFSRLPPTLEDSSLDYLQMAHVVQGYRQLQQTRVLGTVLDKRTGLAERAALLLDTVFKGIVSESKGQPVVISLTPTSTRLANDLLQLAFTLQLPNSKLLAALLDKAKVQNLTSHSTSAHGAVFYGLFKQTINVHVIERAAEFLGHLCERHNIVRHSHVVGSVITGMLEQVARDRELRKKCGPAVVSTVIAQLETLSPWWRSDTATADQKATVLGILTRIILIDAKVIGDVKHQGFTAVFDLYLTMLVDKQTSLTFKSRAMDLLAFFCSLPAKETKKLRSKLDCLVTDYFPAQSSEFLAGSPKYNEYITALKKILSALELSGSLMLLELLMSIVCKEESHIYEDEIQNSIIRFVRRLPLDKQKPALDVPFTIFAREGCFKTEQRRAALEKVCICMLRWVKPPALKEFFVDHIKEVMKIIEAKPVKTPESVFEGQLVSKLCCFQLVEVMFSRLTKEDVRSSGSVINQTYCSPQASKEGKELTLAVTKNAQAAKFEDVRGEMVLLELRRQYHCAAYNALVAMVSCTQTDAKFYTGFLFQEDINKREILWENLVDSKKEYSFPIEMEAPMSRRKKFVAIRHEVRQEDEDDSDVRYLTSQYLADSSLSVDVSQFDFTSSVQATAFGSSSSSPGDDLLEGGSRRRKTSRKASDLENVFDADTNETEVTVRGDYVEMEMDDLNQHECMASLTAVLRHMAANNITPQVEKGHTPASMPKWMGNLHQKIQCHTTPLNVRLFLVKLIVNTEEVFRPYTKFWLGPLVQIITRGDLGTDGINYLMSDLVVTMLSWHTVAIPEDTTVDRAMASRLLEVLMSKCHHESRQVLKNSLEVLKTLVEVWKSRIEVPTSILYENFMEKDQKSTRNMTGIQMTGLVLANGLTPYRPGCGVDKDRFYKFLAMNMLNDRTHVYSSSAEVVGISLKHMSETEKDPASTRWREQYVDNIFSMLLGYQETKQDLFISCIYRMQLHYPAIADRFLARVLFMLPKVHGIFKTHCVDILQSRVDSVENVFIEMKNKDLVGILSYKDEATQHVTLKLVKGMLSYLKPDELLYLLPSVTAFSTSASAVCRAVMYDILMWVYDNYREEDTESVHSIIGQTKDALLLGLSDDDLKNRLTIQNFWSHETRLPVGTLDRLVAMLEAMYSPGSELEYLAYATNLLMEMTSKSPDYNRQIFEHPLSECRFEDYRVTHSWRHRHAIMTPLFVETQQSQGSDGSPPRGDTVVATQVRATQDVQQFTATMQDGGTRPYNWLTQSSMDTMADEALTLGTETQSSLLFTVGSGGRGGSTRTPAKYPASRTYKPVGPGFGKDRLTGPKAERALDPNESQSMEILRLKRRFIKDSKTRSLYFAKKMSRDRKIQEEIIQEQKKRREHQVTMYRKYRIGDLPDIQIQYSNIIAPLQALAQKDSTIARLLFSSVFKAIFAKIEDVKTERECTETSRRIQEGINHMLTNSTQYFPPFVSCLLDIAYAYPVKLRVEPAVISSACVTSMQQPLGIALLEETLIQTDSASEDRPSKRPKGMSGARVSKEITTWLEVARLYKSLGDYDVLQGIFGSQLGTAKLTSQAMEAEMRGDYLLAAKLYSEGLEQHEQWDESPNEIEIDLWDASRLECYQHLGQWEKLVLFSTSEVDDAQPPQLDKIWDDTYFQDTYLPHILKGKLKCLLEEGEGQEDLAGFIDSAMKVNERKALLETKYSEELAILYVWQEEYERASYYVSHALQLFLQDWSNLDDLMANSRSACLQNLQKLTEMQEFLKFMKVASNFSSYQPANQLLEKWVRRPPDPIMDPSDIWDDVNMNRCMFLDQITHKFQAENKMEVDGHSGLFDRHKVTLKLSQADAARQQDNFPVAMKQLRNTLPIVKSLSDETLHIKWTHTYARTHHRKSRVGELGSEENLKALIGTVDNLKKHVASATLPTQPNLKRAHHTLTGDSIYLIINTLQNNTMDLEALPEKMRTQVDGIANCAKKKSFDEVVNSLIEEGYKQYKMAVSDSVNTSEPLSDTEGITAAHMSLVNYCDSYLRQREAEDDSPVDPASINTFPSAVVMSLLTSMKHNSAEACQKFPRLLQLVELYPDTIDIFIKKSAEVPCWMFLGWISQITALLDKPEAPAIHDILLAMAGEYPQAVVYPFKMSSEGYQFPNGRVGKQSQAVQDKMETLLSKNKLVDKLIWAFEQLSQPNQIFKDWYSDTELHRLLEDPRKNAKRIRELFQEMYEQLLDSTRSSEEELYDEETPGTQSERQTPVGMGPFRSKFAKQFAKAVMLKFGKDGGKLLSLSVKQFVKDARSLGEQMDCQPVLCRPPETLKEYSQWLAEFQGCDQNYELEIPGQYTGDKKPLPQYHTKISSFGEKVRVMASIRKPKRILIYGNDQKEYLYLVKGGEDLRQDQRIEQLFCLMNQVFSADSMCRRRKLLLRTYQVIPMTPRVGLIEWMKHTIPLKELLYSNLRENERKFIESTKGPKTELQKFLGTSNINGALPYLNCYKNINRITTITNYKHRESLMPWDLARRAYQNMSASAQAFFLLKNNFATSHGQLSVCQYILGIGDRHLSNFMIDLQNGKSVGIDFGHAFGSATQFLPAPELMPFRLTRQIRNLVMPLREKGLMQGTMVHTLRALRNNSEMLMNTMDVFIKEPSLDWKQFAGKQVKSMEASGEDLEALSTDLEWYPRQKIAYARRKLEGHNPAHITRDELKLGHGKHPYYHKAEKVVLGDKEFDIRAKLPSKGLTVEHQIACLVNQATDANILGRVYVGWESWV